MQLFQAALVPFAERRDIRMSYGNIVITGRPTAEEREQYAVLARNRRNMVAEVLYYYLYEKHNMEEVKLKVGLSDEREVSSITRCNGFFIEGGKSRESGRYGKTGGSKSKPLARHDLKLTMQDFRDYVAEYPEGNLDYRVMDQFMLERDRRNRAPEKPKSNICIQPDSKYDDYIEVKEAGYGNAFSEPDFLRKSNDQGEGSISNAIAVLGCIVIVLIFIFRKKIVAFLFELLPIVFICVIIYAAIKIMLGRKNNSRGRMSDVGGNVYRGKADRNRRSAGTQANEPEGGQSAVAAVSIGWLTWGIAFYWMLHGTVSVVACAVMGAIAAFVFSRLFRKGEAFSVILLPIILAAVCYMYP